METVLRAGVIYLVLWAIFRLTRRRTMAEITAFDFVLLLICSEATQQALVGNDQSLTNAVIVLVTLVLLDGIATALRTRSPAIERIIEAAPLVLMVDGRLLRDRLDKEEITEDDVLHAARQAHGITKLEQIRDVILETNGRISVVPVRR